MILRKKIKILNYNLIYLISSYCFKFLLILIINLAVNFYFFKYCNANINTYSIDCNLKYINKTYNFTNGFSGFLINLNYLNNIEFPNEHFVNSIIEYQNNEVINESQTFTPAELDVIQKIIQNENSNNNNNTNEITLAKNDNHLKLTNNSNKKPYKPLTIAGEKIFTVDNVKVKGNFSKFASENFGTYPGFKYSSELRLNLDGNITENIRINANLDDTNVNQETKKITLYIDSRNWNLTLGDFTSSFNDTEFTLYNKKLKGIEAIGNFKNGKHQIKTILSRSEGKSNTEIFTGLGMQSEYRMSKRPLVQNSEKVILDGRILKRGTDYTIDYEDGSITFKPQLLPLETRNRITVEYEYFENGSMFKRTLIGLRNNLILDMNKLGFSIISEMDDNNLLKGINDYEIKIKPTSLTVYGFDYKLIPKENLKLDGEFAISSFDANTLSNEQVEDKLKNSLAFYNKISYSVPKYLIEFKKQKMNDDFRSIGKNWLDIDKDKNELTLKLDPIDILSLRFDYEESQKRSKNDPDIAKSLNQYVDLNNRLIRTSTIYFFNNKKTNLSVNAYNKTKFNDNTLIHLNEQLYQYELKNEHQNTTERIRYNLRTINSKYDLTKMQKEYTYSFGLTSNLFKLLNYSLETSNIKTKGQLDELLFNIYNYTLDLSSEFNKKLLINTILLSRIEENITTNRKDTNLTTDAKIRYLPTNYIQTQLRYKESQNKKFLLDKSYNDKVLQLKNGTLNNNSNYIVVEEPVTTRLGSLIIDASPIKQFKTQIQYQFKDLININTKAKIANSNSNLLELKYAHNHTLSSTYRITNSKNTQNVGELMNNHNINHNIELRKNLNFKTALISNTEFDFKTDAYKTMENTKTYSQGLKIEKDLNTNLNISSGFNISKIKRLNPFNDSNKLTLLQGIRFTPSKIMLTLRSNIDYSIEDDTLSRFHKTIFDNFIDYNLGSDTEFSLNYKFINANKTIYDDGYKAHIGKMTLTKRF